MNEKDFVKWCKEEITKFYMEHFKKHLTEEEVFIVWCCKTLQNNKALLGTTLIDGMYFELTYNGNKEEMYVDVYEKIKNYKVVKGGN